jgi:hypothetical protein
MNRRQAREFGARARDVLDNPAFVHAVQVLEEKYTRVWMTSEPTQWDEREEAYRALRALNALTDELTILMDNGEIAAHQADIEERRNGY